MEGALCIANIGPGERRKRMRFGISFLVAGGFVGGLLIGFDVHRLWRLTLFVPFWMGGLGLFQALEQT